MDILRLFLTICYNLNVKTRGRSFEIDIARNGRREGYPGFWCECTNCAAARKLGEKNIRGNGCAMLDQDVLIDMNEHFFEMVPRMQIHPSQIDTLLVTHPHRDHFTPVLLTQRAMPKECVGMSAAQMHAYISPCFTWLPEMHIFGNPICGGGDSRRSWIDGERGTLPLCFSFAGSRQRGPSQGELVNIATGKYPY